MKQKINFLMFLFLLSSCDSLPEYKGISLDPNKPYVLWLDHKAKQDVKNERYEEALQRYYEIAQLDMNDFAPHSNIGVMLNTLQRPEEALKSLEHALGLAQQSGDLEGQFALNFNLGVYYGLQKQTEKALEFYQQALEIVPTSVETKTNIELLVQQQQQQDQKNKDGQGQGNSNPQQNQNGENGEQNKEQNKDQQSQNGDQEKKDDQKDSQGQEREKSSRYKPRPFKGDELSEGDVKKILGELRDQEQKIRANFEKKEKGKTKKNEKDW